MHYTVPKIRVYSSHSDMLDACLHSPNRMHGCSPIHYMYVDPTILYWNVILEVKVNWRILPSACACMSCITWNFVDVEIGTYLCNMYTALI